MISPVLPEHSGQYWCVARRGGKTSEYGVSLNVLLQTSYVPPPTIKRVSGGHVTTGETLVLSCSVSVSWAVMVRLSWNLPNPAALPPRLLLPDPVSKNVSVGGTHLKVHIFQGLVLQYFSPLKYFLCVRWWSSGWCCTTWTRRTRAATPAS